MSRPRLVAAGLFAVTVVVMVGCGPGGPTTHAVKGEVKLPEADVKLLAGHTVEVVQENNPLVRAYAEIKTDGSFALETFDKGQVRKGAFEGKYKARIVLSDDNPEQNGQVAGAVHPTYLQFETSGLTIDVPAKNNVTLPILRR